MAPHPHPLSKRTRQKFLNVSGREFASHFQNAMAFGQLAPMRSREEWRREGKGVGLNMEDSKERLAVANCSVYAVSCGCSYQWLEKPVTRNYTLTFGWLHSGLRVWLRRGTCWMKLWLKVFIQCDTVSCPCKTTMKEQTPPLLSHPNDNKR